MALPGILGRLIGRTRQEEAKKSVQPVKQPVAKKPRKQAD